ncbi:Polypyrimidine tract-binding protein 2 [Taenia crassiceps]|uniref:Polypyrimidine tract-binding protein 2 n=1 Tax=Taenia crassiceps TaxID=6207 RepID=A0ABR4QF51_9CEST
MSVGASAVNSAYVTPSKEKCYSLLNIGRFLLQCKQELVDNAGALATRNLDLYMEYLAICFRRDIFKTFIRSFAVKKRPNYADQPEKIRKPVLVKTLRGFQFNDGDHVYKGDILVRQMGLEIYPGENVKLNRDTWDLVALRDGRFVITTETLSPYPDSPLYPVVREEGRVLRRPFVHVVAPPSVPVFKLKRYLLCLIRKDSTHVLADRLIVISYRHLRGRQREGVENVLITKTGQAMLEFQQQESATNMLTYYDLYSPPVIRGTQTITVQYSKHPHLTTTSKRPLLSEIIENVNKAHQALTWSPSSLSSSSRKVLWMQVTNPSTTPLGYVPFYQALFKFGQILRIVTFKSGSYPQAFIEFAQAISTDVAKHQLDGCPFVSGGICRTNYSHMEKLDVHQENQYCRDFTKNPLFLSSDLSGHHQQQGAGLAGAQSRVSPGSNSNTLSPAHSVSNGLPSVQQLASLDVQTLSSFANEVTQALAIAASRFPEPQSQHLQTQANSIRQLIPLVHIAANANGTAGGGGTFVDQAVNMPTGSPVLLVTQLNAEEITLDILFTLFGVYGDVQRVKILYNKKDSALIQFSDAYQANLALQYLNGIPLLGRTLRCQPSRHLSVTPAGELEAELTRDYTGSRLHRFRSVNSRNFSNICAPNTVLHVSGLPEDVCEDEIADLFHRLSGVAPTLVKSMDRDKRMALVEYATLADAVNALIKVDTYQIWPTARIRVTFSKSVVN